MHFSRGTLPISWAVWACILYGCQQSMAVTPSGSAEYRQSEGINLFLRQAVAEFPNWLRENNLDPTPPNPQRANLSSSNDQLQLECEIWDYTASGISKRLDDFRVSSSLSDGLFSVSFDLVDNITFSGAYSATGTVNGTIPVTGSGAWSVVYAQLTQSVYYTFNVTLLDYLEITGTYFSTPISLPWELLDFQFDGLLNGVGDFADVVKEAVVDRLDSFIYEDEVFPAKDSFEQYLRQVFSQITYTEIIGTTFPPSTSPGPCEPCDSQREVYLSNHAQEIVLDERRAEELLKMIDVDLKPRREGSWSLSIKYYEHDEQ